MLSGGAGDADREALQELIAGDGDYDARRRRFPRRPRVHVRADIGSLDAMVASLTAAAGDGDIREAEVVAVYDSMDDVDRAASLRDGVQSGTHIMPSFSSALSSSQRTVPTALARWGSWLDADAKDGCGAAPFPTTGDFSAHPPRAFRALLMRHLACGHDIVLYHS